MQEEFTIDFGDGHTAQCIALEPPEKMDGAAWTHLGITHVPVLGEKDRQILQEYHTPPELFCSDGSPGSIVGDWVAARGGIGGIHHMAYQVESVEAKMKEWKEKGYAEFTSEEPMKCPGLTQCFTKPSALTGVIMEFIERGAHGFCSQNVKQLMESTKGL